MASFRACVPTVGVSAVGIPTRGWLEIEASATGLKVELWRFDGVKLLEVGQLGCELLLPWVGK